LLKAPRPGAVKTRLAQALGAQAACAAYCRLVETLLDRISSLKRLQLRFTPDDASEEIEQWRRVGSWELRPQGAGDLGRRLKVAFEEAFQEGARRVLVIGSDCPSVTVKDLHAASAALARHDVVLGPAFDGGYWLIALRRPQTQLFEKIPWSTNRVLAETLHRARTAGLKVKLLRELSDVDTAQQWQGFLAQSGVRLNK